MKVQKNNKSLDTAKRNSKEAGITLVALAITIIILIILAGVTINLTLKQNGILGQTKTARVLTKIARSRGRGKTNRIR